jgi:hypothetical protein
VTAVTAATVRARSQPRLPHQQVALVDLLDRVLAGGVVLTGEVTLSIADVDLVRISLRALVASVRAAAGPDRGPAPGAPGARRAR